MVGIVGRDHHLIGNHVRLLRRVQAHLRHLAVEHVVGVGVDGERNPLSHLHLTYVGLVDVGYHLHIVKIGDGEDVGNRHIGNDGLPDFHLA